MTRCPGRRRGGAQRERPQRVSIGVALAAVEEARDTSAVTTRARPSQRTTPARWRRCRGAPRRRPRPARPEPRSCARVDEEHRPVLVRAASGGGVIGLQAAAGRSTPRSTTTSVSASTPPSAGAMLRGPCLDRDLIGPPARSSTSEAGGAPRSGPAPARPARAHDYESDHAAPSTRGPPSPRPRRRGSRRRECRPRRGTATRGALRPERATCSASARASARGGQERLAA